jgi:hypothetical protein
MEAKKTIVMFHISGGGGNARKLECIDVDKSIVDCASWNDLFIGLDDKQGLYNCDGNEVLSLDELRHAQSTGIGRLEIDGDYDTTYTTYAEAMSENELRVFLKFRNGNGYDYVLQGYGFTAEAIQLADYFNDWDWLIDANEDNYVANNYDVRDTEPDDEDFLEIDGKFYTEHKKK